MTFRFVTVAPWLTLVIALVGGAAWVSAGVDASQGAAAAAQAAASAPRPAAMTVTLATPRVESWPQTVQATGALAAWQEAVIGAETGSLAVRELHADVGSAVRRGQLLARLDDSSIQADLRKQEAAVAQARASLIQAQANVARVKASDGSGALSGQKIDEYLATEATSRAALASAEADRLSTQIRENQTRIVAVDDGIVSSRSALLGNVVAAGAELFRLVRQGRVEWQAELDAQQLATVAPGQVARLALPGGRVVEGRVRLIAPTLSTSTGRAVAYVSLPSGGGARPGMFASGSIDGPAAAALTVPQAAVVLRDGRSDVYVLQADGSAARRTVTTGRRRGDRIEVTAGLPSDARVIASGAAFLSNGMAVQVADPGGEARGGGRVLASLPNGSAR